MNCFKKELWATPSEQKSAVDCGLITYSMPDVTGLMRIVAKPIALSERQPTDSEKNEHGRCYYGHWYQGSWHWVLSNIQRQGATHFLPAGVEVLPAACFAPEEEKKAEKPKGKAPDAELLLEDWNIKIQKADLSYDPLQRKHYVYVWANIRRKDKRAFDSVVGKFIEIYRDGRLFEIEAEKIRHFIDADNLVSASADIFCKISFYGHE